MKAAARFETAREAMVAEDVQLIDSDLQSRDTV
jgi:hypothetical protein